ncbi:class I SAM-dependent methyltransferase [Maridesulfovibrio hydrothermalis]|nr:class I SAM-dependent methyltransferase [Maridesulfovibrio hydrothermalis]
MQPSYVVEIGTAAGASTALMLKALELLGGERTLHSIEYLEHCYFDKSLKPGFMVDTIYDQHPSWYHLHTSKSVFDLDEITRGRMIDFIFIDGNHMHPWAAIDTILALPFLASDATIVYHDINLHLLADETKKDHQGAHHVFYNFPAAEKITVAGRPYPNIGSLTINGPKINMLAALLQILFNNLWTAHSWPPLTNETLQKLSLELDKHWGENAKLALKQGIEMINATQNKKYNF